MGFGEKLQALRQDSKMSQEKLAERINVSRQAISKWEKGIALPDTDNIVQLSKFFQVPIEYLLLDEYDVVDQVKPTMKYVEEKKESNEKSVYLIILGIVLEIIAMCFTYVVQYYDMSLNGSCYTQALEYLWHLPVSLIVIFGIACMGMGCYRYIKSITERK